MGLTQTSAPAAEPVSTAEAKTHLRVDISDDDSYIDLLVATARQSVEVFLGRQLITATWQWKLDGFPRATRHNPLRAFLLPWPPLQSVTSIAYVDPNGDSQTLAASLYTVDSASHPARIVPAYGEVWPATREHIDVVTLTWVAGYGDAGSDVPEKILTAIKMLVAHWYENREPVVLGTIATKLPMHVESLLWEERIVEFA